MVNRLFYSAILRWFLKNKQTGRLRTRTGNSLTWSTAPTATALFSHSDSVVFEKQTNGEDTHADRNLTHMEHSPDCHGAAHKNDELSVGHGVWLGMAAGSGWWCSLEEGGR